MKICKKIETIRTNILDELKMEVNIFNLGLYIYNVMFIPTEL